jgi:pimeloyl-ACP methyl ester carboxylesterase
MTNIRFFKNRNNLNLAYDYQQFNDPLIIFLSGFRSDMNGTKAQYLKNICIENKFSYLLLDYSGHGQSSGEFTEGSIASWFEDALEIINDVKPNHKTAMVIGSSMGGWIALHVALQLKGFVKGLIGLASAPDFTKIIWDHELSPELKIEITKNGVIYEPSKYGGGDVPITLKLIQESETMCLTHAPIDLNIPVTLIHGLDDTDVSFKRSKLLANIIKSPEIQTYFIENGDHRLSRDEDLTLLSRVVLDMVQKIR